MNADKPTRCEWCGATIQQNSRGRTRRFCNGTCRRNAHRQRGEAWTFLEENDPQLAELPTLDDVYAEHAGEADPPVYGEGCKSLAERAPEFKESGIIPRGVPSPEDSTPAHVSATIVAALAVATEFRRHGLAAPGLVAVRCAAVASALDKALAESFGDVL